MNIAEYSIKTSVVTWMLIILLVGGGFFAYNRLSRYEDPEFTIKDAMVITQYPGATPQEVEQEVTDRIEKSIQQMPQIKRITSLSKPGLSEITVTIQDKYDRKTLPQVWDELRRKVHDVESELPPGAQTPLVNDDYGDVYGMYYAMSGEGFSYRELKHYADFLKKELSLVPGVSKVVIGGEQKEAIFLDISHTRMANLGISITEIENLLKAQNLVTYAGAVKVGTEYLRIQPEGNLNSVQAIGDLLIKSKTNTLLRLSDIATITRGYQEVPEELDYFNGKQALTLGISILSGGNVVKIGHAVDVKLKSLQPAVPIGVNIQPIFSQPTLVDQSIRGFVLSVVEALAIVVAVLLFAMGWRSGLIIAAILLITVFGTLLIMYLCNISLERISLGALIIALGMLVDNAIVVAEGILVQAMRGVEILTAAKEVVSRTKWPLLGATIIGILAFAPISLSQDSTGEYTASLFYVLAISLLLSWILAIMATPLFCYLLIKPKKIEGTPGSDNEYNTPFYLSYQKLLERCIHFRWRTILFVVVLFLLGIFGFFFVKQSFFPNSTTPLFYVHFWGAEGTDVRVTATDMQAIEKYITKLPEVEAVTAIAGRAALRFTLVYSPEKPNSSYGIFLVGVKNYRSINKVSSEIKSYILKNYPNTEPKIEKMRLGPGGGAKIEARVSGPDSVVLRKISSNIQDIMHNNPMAIDIRDDWRQRVKVITPKILPQQSRATGITRSDISDALEMAFSGKNVGLYREQDKLISIIARPPAKERLNIASIDNLQIWSPILQSTVPITQVISAFETTFQNAIIHRRNRIPTITVSCEPRQEPASRLFNQLRPSIEKIQLPSGYFIEWGGEYENSRDAQVALATKLPAGFILMFAVTLLLFGALRQTLIIWLTIPLSIIGVTLGLLSTNMEFGFMALLGLLSLTGMLIKNAIVLIDQIDFEIQAGKRGYEAILDSAKSRLRPVVLAALTTVLGMIPLLTDAFFASMAVVIMFGLTFATLLTLIVVPVLYSIFFRIEKNVNFISSSNE